MNDYKRIAGIIRYLDECHTEQPGLAELAERAGLSEFHFHRLFSRWAGITPKDFLQCLTLSHVKRMLREGQSVLHAALDAGLSGPGRLHDLCVNLEAASPGELKLGGADWTIRACFTESPFGACLVGESHRGICHLSFVDSVSRPAGEAAIGQDWPLARIQWDDSVSELVAPLFQRPGNSNSRPTLRAFVRGTAFQVRVWRALLAVPSGALVSYGELAASIGNRNAARAVGTALGQNPLAWLIPCHRVIRDTAALGNYRWGLTRKRTMIAWESSTQVSNVQVAVPGKIL
jgi:AraC family transcriptional regulator, regulatory protein of adaptative response / methylated-DNA-[protein]-cysteine methyltransferase